jgi:putative tryptophan/tyrosine transport system substrate-binding protein
VRRREFITLFGGAAAVWPLTARAQQPDRVRRIGVLQAINESDPEGQLRKAAFVRGLQKFGWTEGANVMIDYRWGGRRRRPRSPLRDRTHQHAARRDLD